MKQFMTPFVFLYFPEAALPGATRITRSTRRQTGRPSAAVPMKNPE